VSAEDFHCTGVQAESTRAVPVVVAAAAALATIVVQVLEDYQHHGTGLSLTRKVGCTLQWHVLFLRGARNFGSYVASLFIQWASKLFLRSTDTTCKGTVLQKEGKGGFVLLATFFW